MAGVVIGRGDGRLASRVAPACFFNMIFWTRDLESGI
jgi:hypothetical protein